MTVRGGRRWIRWSTSSVRVRMLGGLAGLLVIGLAGSTAITALLLGQYLHDRSAATLQDNASRVRVVLAHGPQRADADQLAALLGRPLGIVAVDSAGRVLLSTGSGTSAAAELARVTAAVPAGRLTKYDGHAGTPPLTAVRIPSPGLVIDRGKNEGSVAPMSLILCIDTSIDNAAITSLVQKQAAVVVATVVLMLALGIFVLRLGMRPLSRMAGTAHAVAAGSLGERLPTRGDRSETDQLAIAVNKAFDAQARAEATVRSFAADASHELRTPLTVISGWLELRRQGGLDGPGLQTALEHIDNEVGRMRLLVEDLGLLARLDAGRPVEQEEVDLTTLADSVVEDAQVVYTRRTIGLVATEPAPVLGDAARLQQVLRNLVGNAVQHTPVPAAVVVAITTTADAVSLTVTDNGPGIAAEDLPRLFERFWRAEASRSRDYGGSGLGLAIVEAIVHAHQGQVSVTSTLGTGTTVTVTLPRAPQPPG